MKRFTFKGVLENFRTSLNQTNKNVTEVEESLRKENFDFAYTMRHGFPHGATSLAYDPVQNLLAIGTESGFIRIFGKPGIDIGVKHVSEAGVQQLLFIVNEGLLISSCADDTLHLWNIKPKQPTMVHSLKFQRERITYSHLPFQSKWLYVGTERGNIHVVNVDSFKLSGYVINWNKTIALISKAHPGPIVHISDSPVDSNKLLIGFESGGIVLWDLKNKVVDGRYSHHVNLCSVSWHYEGKSFISSHSDGSLITWIVKQGQANKPSSIVFPHARSSRPNERSEACSSIDKVEWKITKTGENLIIFSGGLSGLDKERCVIPTMTVMQGKSTTVLEMEHPIVDFLAISRSPYPSEPCEPNVLTVLYRCDLVLVDLTTQGFPCFENPFALDVHESPVTVVKYFADCPGEIIPLLYSVGMRQKKTGYSEKNWPLTGGEGGKFSSSYPEIILTGHADGTVKFWDASAMNLQILYRLKSSKLFERQPNIARKRASPSRSDNECGPDHNYPSRSQTPAEGQDNNDGDLLYKKNLAVAELTFDPGSRYLAVVGGGDAPDYTVLYSFDRSENRIPQIPFLCVQVEDDREDLDGSSIPAPVLSNETSASPIPPPRHKDAKHSGTLMPDNLTPGHPNISTTMSNFLKKGALKQLPGFQVELVIFLSSPSSSSITESTGHSTSTQSTGDDGLRVKILAVKIQPIYGLIAIGTTSGLCIIDFVNKSILINLSTPDFYGSSDPFSRFSKLFPNKRPPSTDPDAEKVKSPSIELVPAPSLTGNTTTADVTKGASNKLGRDRSASAKVRLKNKSTVASGKRRATLNQILGHIGLDYFGSSPQTESKTLKLSQEILRESEGEHEGEQYNFDDTLSCQDNYVNALRRLKPIIHLIETEYCGISEEDILIVSDDSTGNVATGLENASKPLSMPLQDNITNTTGSKGGLADKYKPAKLIDSNIVGNSGKILQTPKKPTAIKTFDVKSDDYDHELPCAKGTENKTNIGKSTNTVREHTGGGSLNQGPNAVTINNLQSPPGPESLTVGSPTSSGLGFPLEGVVDLAFYHQALSPSMASKSGNQTSFSSNLAAPSTSTSSGSANQERCNDNEIGGPLPPLWLWMGTSYGSTLVLSFSAFTSSSIPFNSKTNAAPVGAQQPVIVSPTGSIFRLKGSMLNISYFTNPIINQPSISSPSQPCAPTSATTKKTTFSNTLGGDVATPGPTSSVTILPGSISAGTVEHDTQIGGGTTESGKMLGHQISVASTSSTVGGSCPSTSSYREFAILISEFQACAVALPSMSVTYKVKTATDGRKILTARVCKFYNQHCLTCYSSNGHIVVYSVPSFRLLFDIFLVSPSDLRFNSEDHEEITDIRRVVSFSSHGNGLYLCSPSEIQKFTYSAELCKHLMDMTSRLFRVRETPEPPKPNFFTNLFNNKSLAFDREELFGEASGKYSRAQATHIPGPSSALQDTAQNANALAAGPVQKARLALNERGEKLGNLDERIAHMAMHAEDYSKNAHDIMLKYKEKKWYQF